MGKIIRHPSDRSVQGLLFDLNARVGEIESIYIAVKYKDDVFETCYTPQLTSDLCFHKEMLDSVIRRRIDGKEED